jgi:hypothetical protein
MYNNLVNRIYEEIPVGVSFFFLERKTMFLEKKLKENFKEIVNVF